MIDLEVWTVCFIDMLHSERFFFLFLFLYSRMCTVLVMGKWFVLSWWSGCFVLIWLRYMLLWLLCMSVFLLIHLPTHLPRHPFIHPSFHPDICLPIYLQTPVKAILCSFIHHLLSQPSLYPIILKHSDINSSFVQSPVQLFIPFSTPSVICLYHVLSRYWFLHSELKGYSTFACSIAWLSVFPVICQFFMYASTM